MAGKKSTADKEAVVADYQAGLKVRDIAKKHGVGTDTVYAWIKKAGVKTRHNKHKSKPKDAVLAGNGHWFTDDKGIQRWVSNG